MQSLLEETVRFVPNICQPYTWTILGHLCGLSVIVRDKNLPKLCLYSRPARRDSSLKTLANEKCLPLALENFYTLQAALPSLIESPSPVMAAEVTLFFIEINKSKRSN